MTAETQPSAQSGKGKHATAKQQPQGRHQPRIGSNSLAPPTSQPAFPCAAKPADVSPSKSASEGLSPGSCRGTASTPASRGSCAAARDHRQQSCAQLRLHANASGTVLDGGEAAQQDTQQQQMPSVAEPPGSTIPETQLAPETQAVEDWEGMLQALQEPTLPAPLTALNALDHPSQSLQPGSLQPPRPPNPTALQPTCQERQLGTTLPAVDLDLVLTDDDPEAGPGPGPVVGAEQPMPDLPERSQRTDVHHCQLTTPQAMHFNTEQPHVSAEGQQSDACPAEPARSGHLRVDPASAGTPDQQISFHTAPAMHSQPSNVQPARHGDNAEAGAVQQGCQHLSRAGGTLAPIAGTQVTEYGECSLYPSLQGSKVVPGQSVFLLLPCSMCCNASDLTTSFLDHDFCL